MHRLKFLSSIFSVKSDVDKFYIIKKKKQILQMFLDFILFTGVVV